MEESYLLLERYQLVEHIGRLVTLIETHPTNDVHERRNRQDQLMYMKGYQSMLERRIEALGRTKGST